MIMLHGFFEEARRGRLTAVRCPHCGWLAIPPRAACSACGERDWERVRLAGTGTVASFTVVRGLPGRRAPEAPYAVALVHLTEGVSLLGRIVDIPTHSLTVGQAVRFRPLVEVNQTGIAFGPA